MVGEHPVQLRGLTFDPHSGAPLPSSGGAPVICERMDDEFIQALLGDLKTAEGRKALLGTVLSAAPSRSGGLKLLQPVHGVFNLALLEAHCERFGEPRLDPLDIESAGIVIRRAGGAAREAWVKRDGKVAGWIPLHGDELDRDPDPKHREGPQGPGPAEVRRELLRRMGATSSDEESVMDMFTAPPDVCTALGRTVLLGMISTASAEAPDPGTLAAPPSYEASEIKSLLLPYLGNAKAVVWTGLEGRAVSFADLTSTALSQDLRDRLSLFRDFVRGLVAVFDAFETPKLEAALDRVKLDYGGKEQRPAGQALAAIADVLVMGRPGTATLPRSWPSVSPADFSEILNQARAAASARVSQLVSAERRFDRRRALYVARAFVRVQRDGGCPPKIVWSPESAPFSIAAWHEPGKLPPVQISLPPLTDLKAFKPNVTFKLPTDLFALLKQEPKDFLEGKAGKKAGDGIAWLCSFNIPIITLVAFIVLNIFLSLLNLIFFWLALVKICIPIPASLKARFEE
jgi:hypothetical protein